jgi:flavin-dependent dehydrogenase
MARASSKRSIAAELSTPSVMRDSGLCLEDGSRVAVMGGGPAGSFFAYFLLDMARMVDLELQVDIYEPRDYTKIGPAGCNNCGGIVSESLVQHLATEGITLPDNVVQRGIDSYVMHTMDGATVHIDTPLGEKRIASVHRGAGPRDAEGSCWSSFDGFLQSLAIEKGANVVRKRISDVALQPVGVRVSTRDEDVQIYDLLAVAVGVNTGILKTLDKLDLQYEPPQTSKTYISELHLGRDRVVKYLGSSMHVFLLNLPRLEFSALIPKGDYVTLCLLGEDIDGTMVDAFLDAPQVKKCLPPDWKRPEGYCHCSPKINVRGAARPFADRMVFIGDCGVTRLYKDGIGAAYRTAKAAARTAIHEGIAADDFQHGYWPTCRSLDRDNRVGEFVFTMNRFLQKLKPARLGVTRMVRTEQEGNSSRPRMSMVMWDLFTGSAPYKDILFRTLRPAFLVNLFWNFAAAALGKRD